MVARRSFPFGMAYFQGRTVSFRQCILYKFLWCNMLTDVDRILPEEVEKIRGFNPAAYQGPAIFLYNPPLEKGSNHQLGKMAMWTIFDTNPVKYRWMMTGTDDVWTITLGGMIHHFNSWCLEGKVRSFQWLFLVPVKGGRWHIIPQLAVFTTYSPCLRLGGENCYRSHLLREPEGQPLKFG